MEDRPLDEIFSLRPDLLKPAVETPEPEIVPEKKKKKKKKKHVRIEYDPDLDEVVHTKKHKRDEDFGDW